MVLSKKKGVRRREQERNTDCLSKYDILEEIGQGGSCRVFLARHKILGALRAVKCISRSHPGYETFLQESRVLQNLNHPGIPRIYDMEEDVHAFYLIEEYVSGKSLQTLRSVQSNFSQERIIGYGIEICNIIQYLHEQQPFPLIYLDLKPEHILVTPGGIRLIDFGAVTEERQSDYRAGILGTPGFCAPELSEGLPPRTQADIYSIGAVLYFLLYGQVYSGKGRKSFLGKERNKGLLRVIRKCLEPKESRYTDIRLLKRDLETLRTNQEPGEPSSLKIAVAGARKQSGVTHFSIGLTSYLNKTDRGAVYWDKSGKNTVDTILEYGSAYEESGYVWQKDFCGVPNYGPGVFVETSGSGCRVLDFGSDISQKMNEICECERFYFLIGSSLWEPVVLGSLNTILEKGMAASNLRLVVQYGLTEENRRLLKRLGIRNCSVMPFYQDIWSPGSKTAQFYSRLWNRRV